MRRTYTILQLFAVMAVIFASLMGAGLSARAYLRSAGGSHRPTPCPKCPTRQTSPTRLTRLTRLIPTPNAQRPKPNPQPAIRGITVEPRDISLNGQRSEGRVAVSGLKADGALDDATPEARL